MDYSSAQRYRNRDPHFSQVYNQDQVIVKFTQYTVQNSMIFWTQSTNQCFINISCWKNEKQMGTFETFKLRMTKFMWLIYGVFFVFQIQYAKAQMVKLWTRIP